MRIRPYYPLAFVFPLLVATSQTAPSATDTFVRAESVNAQASARAEDIGTTMASVDVFRQDSLPTPNTVTARATSSAEFGFISQSVYFDKNRNADGDGLDYRGRASANGRFNDTLSIIPNDSSMNGTVVLLEVRIRLNGAGRVSQAEGSDGSFGVRSAFTLGQYDLSDPEFTSNRSNLGLAAEVRSYANGDFRDGVNSATTGGEDRTVYLTLTLNQLTGIYAEQELTAQMLRSRNGQLVGGTLEGDFTGTIQFTGIRDNSSNPLDPADFSFITGTGTDYFVAVPEPTTVGFLGLTLLVVIGTLTRKRLSRS